jgi:hypothetical protein
MEQRWICVVGTVARWKALSRDSVVVVKDLEVLREFIELQVDNLRFANVLYCTVQYRTVPVLVQYNTVHKRVIRFAHFT